MPILYTDGKSMQLFACVFEFCRPQPESSKASNRSTSLSISFSLPTRGAGIWQLKLEMLISMIPWLAWGFHKSDIHAPLGAVRFVFSCGWSKKGALVKSTSRFPGRGKKCLPPMLSFPTWFQDTGHKEASEGPNIFIVTVSPFWNRFEIHFRSLGTWCKAKYRGMFWNCNV